jgi:hypothetical protein
MGISFQPIRDIAIKCTLADANRKVKDAKCLAYQAGHSFVYEEIVNIFTLFEQSLAVFLIWVQDIHKCDSKPLLRHLSPIAITDSYPEAEEGEVAAEVRICPRSVVPFFFFTSILSLTASRALPS